MVDYYVNLVYLAILEGRSLLPLDNVSDTFTVFFDIVAEKGLDSIYLRFPEIAYRGNDYIDTVNICMFRDSGD